MTTHTIIGRTNTGAFTQTLHLESDVDFSIMVARRILNAETSTNHVEIYEGRFRYMDFPMKPLLYIYRDNVVSSERVHK
jgi:hypothetical protein